ncbi:hypothetical protein E2C01_078068 [Portunus trituberculatus]|uniref:Uncharacterized protein n=1 Tax=Portunus trituberculatus TaxID=210409 RepID=A0A5B7IMW6_PORTR|nr:hypothetical protein [Portunus trituberculatus]
MSLLQHRGRSECVSGAPWSVVSLRWCAVWASAAAPSRRPSVDEFFAATRCPLTAGLPGHTVDIQESRSPWRTFSLHVLQLTSAELSCQLPCSCVAAPFPCLSVHFPWATPRGSSRTYTSGRNTWRIAITTILLRVAKLRKGEVANTLENDSEVMKSGKRPTM